MVRRPLWLKVNWVADCACGNEFCRRRDTRPTYHATAEASKISNTGVVVGSYVADGLRHGYAFENGTYTKIDISPTVGSLIDAVNKFDNVIAEKIEGSVDPLFKGFCSAAF